MQDVVPENKVSLLKKIVGLLALVAGVNWIIVAAKINAESKIPDVFSLVGDVKLPVERTKLRKIVYLAAGASAAYAAKELLSP